MLMIDETPDHIPGTPEEFESFLERHYDRIHAYAYRVLGSRHDAEDLAQDICLALPAKLRAFRGDCCITTWLYRVVANAAIDRLRKMKTRQASNAGWQDVLTSNAEDGREKQEALNWLSKAMTSLPDELRVTAALLVDEDLTQAQAAEILDVAPGTVAWRMSEIKRRLRKVAEEDWNV